MTNEELAELERMLAKATPGEWSCLNKVGVVFGPDCQVAHCGDFGDKELVPFNADRWQSDAALIVALRNAAPSLIATAREAEALRAENARLTLTVRKLQGNQAALEAALKQGEVK